MKIKITKGQTVAITALSDIDPVKDLLSKLPLLLDMGSYPDNEGFYCCDAYPGNNGRNFYGDDFDETQEKGFLLYYDKENTGALIISGYAASCGEFVAKRFVATVEKIMD